jgi:hypothetical protein
MAVVQAAAMGLLKRALVATALLAAATAGAHNMPGVAHIKPGQPFHFLNMRAVLPDPASAKLGEVEFDPLRGFALAFLVIDPSQPANLAEAHRFERLVKQLPNTRGFLVALPERSQRPKWLVQIATQERFSLPLLIDARDIFPFSFGFGLNDSPRFELFDRAGTLILENPARLDQRLVTGLTIEGAIRELDAGHTVEPAQLTGRDDIPQRPKP